MPALDSSFWHRLGPRGVNDEVGDEVAQVYLAAFTYRFNRRFDLRGHVERLIDDVARTPPKRVDGAEVTLHWCDVDAIGRCAAQLPVASFSAAGPLPAFERSRAFAHQPRADTAWANAGPMAALRQLFSRWRGR